MVTSIAPGFHHSHGGQLARSLGTVVPFPSPLPQGLRPAGGFPTRRLLCPLGLPAGPRSLRCGSPLPPRPLSSPGRRTRHAVGGVCLCPNRSARLPRLWTEGSTGGPLSPGPSPLAGLGPSSHRSSLMAGAPGGHHRQGLSGSAFPEGLDHAAGDAPWRSAATPPPLAGLSPAHGALQEHAAHVREWSTTLRAKGSLRTCIPKVFPHSSMPLHGAPSEGCWRRLQCLVRRGPGEPYCSAPRPHGSWYLTR